MAKTWNVKRTFIGDEQLPYGLHTQILSRFMKEKEMKALWQSYNEAKLKSGGHISKPPTAEQIKMAKAVRSGKDRRTVANENNVPYSTVQNAVNRVALWDYLHPEK